MSRFMSSIVKTIARAAIIVAFGTATLAGVAYADQPDVRSHASEMNTGKDHYSSSAAEGRRSAPDSLRGPNAPAPRHMAEMNSGKDHYAAWASSTTSTGSSAQSTQATRHVEAMNNGKDHYDALRASR